MKHWHKLQYALVLTLVAGTVAALYLALDWIGTPDTFTEHVLTAAVVTAIPMLLVGIAIGFILGYATVAHEQAKHNKAVMAKLNRIEKK